MTDKDFIIEEPETLDIEPEEEVLTFEPKEEVLSFDVPAKSSIEDVTPILQPNVEQVVSSTNEVKTQPVTQPVYNIVPPSVADARDKDNEDAELLDFDFGPKSTDNTNNQSQTITQATSQPVNVVDTQVQPQSLNNSQAVTEEAIIKEVVTAAPNKINDDVLKVEDTMLSNNLKEDVNEALQVKDEESQNKRARAFIITLFLLLGVTILLLPVLTNIFS